MKYKTVRVRSVLIPRWWQIRRRWYMRRLRTDSGNKLVTEETLERLHQELDRRIIFGEGDDGLSR